MPNINFPYPATAGQTYTYNGVTWTYNGYAWSSTTNLSLQYVTDVGNTTTNDLIVNGTGTFTSLKSNNFLYGAGDRYKMSLAQTYTNIYSEPNSSIYLGDVNRYANFVFYPSTGSLLITTNQDSDNAINASYSLQIKNGSSELFNVGKNGSVAIGATASSAGRLQITNTSAMDGGQLGNELLSSAGWTSTGWTPVYPTFTHNTGNTSVLSNTVSATSGNYYQVVCTITNRTAGSIRVVFGGVDINQGDITKTLYSGFRATTSTALTVTPTNSFDGTVSLSIKRVTAGTATVTMIDSGGTSSNEIRAFGGASGSNTNFAMGLYAGQRLVNGTYNTFIGYQAGANTISTDGNLGIGYQALNSNTLGTLNTAIGQSALNSNTYGFGNMALGFASLGSNTTGNGNFGLGYATFSNLTSGGSNIAIGTNTGRYASNGITTLTSADNSILIGTNVYPEAVGQTGQIVIGYGATGYGSFTTTIGSTGTIKTILRGNVLIGTTTDTGQNLQVTGTFKTTGTNTLTDLGGTGTRVVATDNTGKLSVAYGYNFSGSITSTGTTATVNLLTITIPANSLTDYLNVRSIMFEQSGTTLAGVQVKIWTGTTNVFGSATQISNYSFGAGGNLFAQISRSYSLQSGLLIGYPQTTNSATGTGASQAAILSISFNTAITNYLFISFQLSDATDTVTLRNVNITY